MKRVKQLSLLLKSRQLIAAAARANFSQLGHNIEINSEHNLIQRKAEFKALYKVNHDVKINGFATPEGTKKFTEYKNEQIDKSNFRSPFNSELTLSSIGYGSYQGSPDEIDDLKMFNAIVDSITSGGVNVIDTALNFRYMKSERTIAAALRYLQNQKKITRDQLFIASKGGFLSEDADQGIPSGIFMNKLIADKRITEEDIVGTCHCMHPEYLSETIDQSLNNLGLSTLDLYYIQNASEAQMPIIGEDKFYDRLAKAFELLEKKVAENKIKQYGLATWVGFRAKPEEQNIYLSLQKVAQIAEQVGGKNNAFKYIQLPINVMMPESFSERWQKYQNAQGEIEDQFLLRVATELQINVIASSPLMSGTLINCPLPSDVFKCANQGAKHLQFVRSIPSKSIISNFHQGTLVGQKANRHVKKNLEVVLNPKLTEDEFWEFLIPSKREQDQEESINVN